MGGSRGQTGGSNRPTGGNFDQVSGEPPLHCGNGFPGGGSIRRIGKNDFGTGQSVSVHAGRESGGTLTQCSLTFYFASNSSTVMEQGG
jgi:hypothetical protein